MTTKPTELELDLASFKREDRQIRADNLRDSVLLFENRRRRGSANVHAYALGRLISIARRNVPLDDMILSVLAVNQALEWSRTRYMPL